MAVPSSSTDTPLIDCLSPPGIATVFCHGLCSMPNPGPLKAMLHELDVFAERALLAAGPGDVVCVPRPVDGDFLRYLGELGIGPGPGNVVAAGPAGDAATEPLSARFAAGGTPLERVVERLEPRKGVRVSPFIASRADAGLGRRLAELLGRPVEVLGGNPEAVRRACHKHLARAKAVELGVPVAPGEVVEAPGEGGEAGRLRRLREAILRHIGRTGRVIIRGTLGASGDSTVLVDDGVEDAERALEAVAEWTENRPYLVESMLPMEASPNVQAFIEPGAGRVSIVSVSDQRLDRELQYDGNVWPSQARTLPRMVDATRRLASWLREQGCTGLIGCDFVEHGADGGEGPDFILAELNPRTNACTYGWCLFEKLNRRRGAAPRVDAFLSAGAKTTARSFAEFRRRHAERLFDPALGRGLVPYGTGRLRHGEISLVFLGGSRPEVLRLYEEFISASA